MMQLSHFSAGLTAIVIGYSSSVALIVELFRALRLSEQQSILWLAVLGIVLGFFTIALSLRYKIPLLLAWSTPGAIFLISVAQDYPVESVVGACIMTGALIFISGLVPFVSRLLSAIPAGISTSMLAALILPLCVKGAGVNADQPEIIMILLLAFLITKRFLAQFCIPLIFVACLVLSWTNIMEQSFALDIPLSEELWIWPIFSLNIFINLSLPLFLITMLSQNLPGLALIQQFGFKPPGQAILSVTGGVNAIGAMVGIFSVNLAAISAAVCLSPEAGKEQDKRYYAAVLAGVIYLGAGIFAASLLALLEAIPMTIISALVMFALLGTLVVCLQGAFKDKDSSDVSALTFVVTLSGVQFFGFGAVIWGLASGLLAYLVLHKLPRPASMN